jgi:hypothetical protein
MLAGKQDHGDYSGRLEVPNLGPITVADIAGKTKYSPRRQQAAIDEIVRAGWLSRDLTGTLVVERFKEKSAPLSAVSTPRSRAHRERSRNGKETFPERRGNGAEAEAEAEAYCASLRSAAIGRGEWPPDPDSLSALALLFIARFANCPDPVRGEQWAQAYSSFLAGARRDGWTIEQTWKACEDCWLGGKGKPLFDNLISRARNHFPSRSEAAAKKKPSTYLERQGLKTATEPS